MLKNKIFKLLFLSLCVTLHDGAKKGDICDEPDTSCGRIPPTIPTSFIMKSLVLDPLNKQFFWEEEYFDPESLRGKVVQILKGKEVTTIFDYSAKIITIYERFHPGAPLDQDPASETVCLTQPMASSLQRTKLGYKFGKYNEKFSNMYSSNEALGFGGPFKYSYNGTATLAERGIETDMFVGCVYDKYADKTVLKHFYWTTKNLFTATGARTMPARILSVGGYYDQGTTPIWNKQDFRTDVVWYEENPVMEDEFFLPPPRMFCQTDKRSKEIPKMPRFHSARTESTITTEDFDGKVQSISYDWYEEHWMDHDLNLVRQDFYPNLVQKIFLAVIFGTDVPTQVSGIYDFNTGIAYLTDETYGNCVPTTIPDWLYFVEKSSDGKTVSLAPPNKVFDLDNENLNYKGEYRMRDMKCAAWSGQGNFTAPGKTDTFPAFREVYFTTEGWHSENDGEQIFTIPVQDTRVFSSEFGGQKAVDFFELNFYKFSARKPALSVYDISSCIEHHERRFFLMTFSANDRQLIETYTQLFLDETRLVIMNIASLGSPLRVQELSVLFHEGKMNLYFTIMDVPSIKGDVINPLRGVEMKIAVANLKSSLDKELFSVQLITRPGEAKRVLMADRSSLREIDRIKNTVIDVKEVLLSDQPSQKPLEPQYLKVLASELDKLSSPFTYQSPDEPETKPGYSQGAIGGLAVAMLLVGLAVGVTVMWFYLRRLKKADTETANFGLDTR